MANSSSPLSSPNYYSIYTGMWTNWSHGPILGATITLTRHNGGFLISFLSLFIAWTGAASWRIACFIFHHYYSSEAPRDALHHQRQVILRNSANATSAVYALGQTTWTWRSKTSHIYRRMIPIMIFAVIFLGAFSIAGIFSSKIATTTSTQVLISSPSCGLFNPSKDVDPTDLRTILVPYFNKLFVDSANYAEQCYTNISSPEECRKYVQRQLPWAVNRNASCPFEAGLCRNAFGNLELDSGLINSNEGLGLNEPSNEQFNYRTRLLCAPLISDGYKQPYVYSAEGIQVRYLRYYYGKSRAHSDFTFEYPEDSVLHTRDQGDPGAGQDYSLGIKSALFKNGSLDIYSQFDPIPGLRHLEGDVTLFFLSHNSVLFANQTNDPLYSAHKAFSNASLFFLAGSTQVYKADEPTSVLTCINQHQFCDPSLPRDKRCTPLGSFFDTERRVQSIWPNRKQTAHMEWFSTALELSNVKNVVSSLGVTALTSRYSLTGGIQGPISQSQWQLEVEHWFKASLASLQKWVLESAAGPSNPQVMRWMEPPSNEIERSVCRNQKILTTAYTNFNAFGLYLTLIVGSLVIIISYAIEPLVGCVKKRRNLDEYSRLEWCANETLQLQRLAHEPLGLGTWHGGAKCTPFTERREMMAMLDIENPDHPKLKAPPVHFDELFARGDATKSYDRNT